MDCGERDCPSVQPSDRLLRSEELARPAGDGDYPFQYAAPVAAIMARDCASWLQTNMHVSSIMGAGEGCDVPEEGFAVHK